MAVNLKISEIKYNLAPLRAKKGPLRGVILDVPMRDYSDDPAFIKQRERAKEFLKQHPLPTEFFDKK